MLDKKLLKLNKKSSQYMENSEIENNLQGFVKYFTASNIKLKVIYNLYIIFINSEFIFFVLNFIYLKKI